MSRRHSLGDLQLAIIRVLWKRGEASVAEVHRTLQDERGLAPTTIATMLVKMEKKGVVAHHLDGRRFIYQPTISEEQVRRGMVDELTERLFGGDTGALVAHLLSAERTSEAELEEIRKQIAEYDRQGKS